MKTVYNYLLASVCLLWVLVGCKKVEHAIPDEIVSFNESTPTAVQVGQKLKVGFLTNNVKSFDFSLVKDGTSILQEQIILSDNQKIIEKEFDIPLNEEYVGEAVLRVTYTAGGQNITKERPITLQESNPVMYVVGGSLGAGWDPTRASMMTVYDPDSKTKFEIFEYLTAEGGFKFLPTNIDWKGGYGKGSAAGSLMQDEEAENLTVSEDGFYRIRMDAEALTYEVLKINMGVIGDATPGGWDKDTDMVFEGGKGSYTWKVTIDLVPGKIKFRANDQWTINFGGDLNNLTQDGPDIEIASAGTYDITLQLTPGAYKAILEKK